MDLVVIYVNPVTLYSIYKSEMSIMGQAGQNAGPKLTTLPHSSPAELGATNYKRPYSEKHSAALLPLKCILN